MVTQAEFVFIEKLGTRGVLVSRHVWILEYSDNVAMTLKGFQISRFWVRDTGLCQAEWRCWELRLGGQEAGRLQVGTQQAGAGPGMVLASATAPRLEWSVQV